MGVLDVEQETCREARNFLVRAGGTRNHRGGGSAYAASWLSSRCEPPMAGRAGGGARRVNLSRRRRGFLSPLKGLGVTGAFTRGLRPGLHSFAASRLVSLGGCGWCSFGRGWSVAA